MATELKVFVPVWVTVNAPLLWASPIEITRTWTGTGTHVNVNAALWVVTSRVPVVQSQFTHSSQSKQKQSRM